MNDLWTGKIESVTASSLSETPYDSLTRGSHV